MRACRRRSVVRSFGRSVVRSLVATDNERRTTDGTNATVGSFRRSRIRSVVSPSFDFIRSRRASLRHACVGPPSMYLSRCGPLINPIPANRPHAPTGGRAHSRDPTDGAFGSRTYVRTYVSDGPTARRTHRPFVNRWLGLCEPINKNKYSCNDFTTFERIERLPPTVLLSPPHQSSWANSQHHLFSDLHVDSTPL